MPDDGWVPVANTTAQGRRLSWRAKGLLMDLLSYPDGYRITFKQLMDEAKKAGDPDVEGRDAMRKSMQELERKGYLKHQRVEVKDPAPGGQRWRTETFICDQPIYADHAGDTRSQDHQDSGPPDFSSPEDQELFNNTDSYKTNQQQEEAGKSSSALASARAGQRAGANDLPPELADLYDSARELDDDRLRRLLLQFEDRRPTKYRDARRSALAQLKAEDPKAAKRAHSVRSVDLLSFMYGLQHYYNAERPAVGIPVWLRRFPR
jgi:hypothetical protein